VGTKEKGQEYLAAISSWDGERCLLNEVDEKSFLHQQDSVAQVLRGKGEGVLYFIYQPGLTGLALASWKTVVHTLCLGYLASG
jgi:hypothetical protein